MISYGSYFMCTWRCQTIYEGGQKNKRKEEEEAAQSKTMQLSKAKFRENAAGQKFLQP